MTPDLVARFDGRPLAVETRGLVKRYGSRTALDGVELTVPEGAVYVLVGPNGAGKTTTLRLLLGLVRADAGDARVLGLSTTAAGPTVRASIGHVPESHDFGYGDLRVDRLLAHHRAYFPAWDDAYAARLLDRLAVPVAVRYRRLSKGLARRVQLVLALAHRPPLLLLDEPTDGLDPLAREEVLSLLADHLAAAPTTVLVSTHLVHEIEGLGDCLGVLAGGRLVAQQERAELERRLHLVYAEVPEGWNGAPALAGSVVDRSDKGREIAWTLWGEPAESVAALTAAGATVRHHTGLNLEDATRVLLRRSKR